MCIFKAPSISAPAAPEIKPPEIKPMEELAVPKMGADDVDNTRKAAGKESLKISKEPPKETKGTTGINKAGFGSTTKGGK
ncbi:hypothetical protein [Chromobacterium haemolyticum]|uniref:hypothetical protein n=1 Tax=Chromobacterium haemolyticum TaxID=394935 RepID=UPI0011B1F4C5|nr:hypothetical protein [Chromobacterium haemolyticum]